MTVTISAAHNTARLEGTLAFVDTGTGTAKISLYTTARGLITDTPGTAISEIALAVPSGTVDASGYHFATAGDGFNTASGVAKWARLTSRSGATVADFDVRKDSDSPALGEIALPDTQLYAGGVTRLASGTLT